MELLSDLPDSDQFAIASKLSKRLPNCDCKRANEHVSLVCMNKDCPHYDSQPYYCSSCVEDRHVHEVNYIHKVLLNFHKTSMAEQDQLTTQYDQISKNIGDHLGVLTTID